MDPLSNSFNKFVEKRLRERFGDGKQKPLLGGNVQNIVSKSGEVFTPYAGLANVKPKQAKTVKPKAVSPKPVKLMRWEEVAAQKQMHEMKKINRASDAFRSGPTGDRPTFDSNKRVQMPRDVRERYAIKTKEDEANSYRTDDYLQDLERQILEALGSSDDMNYGPTDPRYRPPSRRKPL
jgi:hypothetical protein